MNRLVSKSRPRNQTPRIVATLNLADESQRRLHHLIRRLHGGRWPILRCLGMRQVNGVLYEAVEWLRLAKPSFGVVMWCADGLGLSWTECRTSRKARDQLLLPGTGAPR